MFIADIHNDQFVNLDQVTWVERYVDREDADLVKVRVHFAGGAPMELCASDSARFISMLDYWEREQGVERGRPLEDY